MSGGKAAKSFSFWRSAPSRLPVLDNGVPVVQLAPRIYALIYRKYHSCAWHDTLVQCETMCLSGTPHSSKCAPQRALLKL